MGDIICASYDIDKRLVDSSKYKRRGSKVLVFELTLTRPQDPHLRTLPFDSPAGPAAADSWIIPYNVGGKFRFDQLLLRKSSLSEQ
jgi:hypothetical protein